MKERYLDIDSSRGYTDRLERAVRREPQALYEDEQRAISIRARAQFAETRKEENERKDNQQWLERLRRAEMAATSKGVDIFRSQAAIRKEILNIEQRIMGSGTLVSA